MNDASPVRVACDGDVLTISLNRPGSLNALDLGAALALGRAIDDASSMTSIRAVVIRGEGRSFCGGGDVAAMHAHRDDLPAFVAGVIDAFHVGVLALARLPVPVIASVHGAVAGGGISLALACDLVVAARSTRLVVAYPQLGTSTDGGLTFRLVERLGASRAFDVLTQRRPIDAEKALSLGLVNRVVDDGTHDEAARQWARDLAALAPQAVRELKRLVSEQRIAALEEQLARERAAFVRCAATADFAARVAAFATRASRTA